MFSLSDSLLFLLIVCICVFKNVQCDRTYTKIYYDVEGINACFRRLNGTQQIGCASERNGNVGVVHVVSQTQDLDWLINNGPHKPYVILLSPYLFTRDVLMRITGSGKVNGILLDRSNTTNIPSQFSPDQTCPNQQHSFYRDTSLRGQCDWNKEGTALMFEDWKLPIIAITNASHIEFLTDKCYKRYNEPRDDGSARDYPLCSALVKDIMSAAVDTPTCTRRSRQITNLNPEIQCDPLGDLNVHTLLGVKNTTGDTLPPQSVVMVTAKMDSFSMFDELYPSADSTVTGLVTLLAAAQALVSVDRQLREADRMLMFSFMHGESFDYMGSERFLYDLERDKIWIHSKSGPSTVLLMKKHLHSLVEVSQLSERGGGQLWVHTDPITYKNDSVKQQVDQMVSTVRSEATRYGVDIQEASKDAPLPPSSYQSFIKKMNLPGVVITNHQQEYLNKFYNSIYDLPAMIDDERPGEPNATYDLMTPAAIHLQKVATVTARTLYSLVTGNNAPDDLVADNATVTHLLSCFLHFPRCSLFLDVTDVNTSKQLGDKPISFYVGVRQSSGFSLSMSRVITQMLMTYFQGRHIEYADLDNCIILDRKNKNKSYRYVWINGPIQSVSGKRIGLCYKTTTNTSFATSPAFDIDNYDWKSNEYTAWTESRWASSALEVRVFLVPSQSREIGLLCGGLAMFLVSMAITYFISKRAGTLFHVSHSAVSINEAF